MLIDDLNFCGGGAWISRSDRKIWRRPRFLPTFLAFCKAKTGYFSHFFEAQKKGKGKKQKGKKKSALFPQF